MSDVEQGTAETGGDEIPGDPDVTLTGREEALGDDETLGVGDEILSPAETPGATEISGRGEQTGR